MRQIGLGLLMLLLTGCGYRFGDPDRLAYRYHTISVPYVAGDTDGQLTNTLIRRLSASGGWRYKAHGGDVVLCAKVVTCGHENIGFQYDRNDQDQLVDRLLPNEGRLTLGLEVELKCQGSGKRLLGPVCVKGTLDYDYDPSTTDNSLAVFSLGQFTIIDEAQEIVKVAIYDQLAQKVVDLVSNACI